MNKNIKNIYCHHCKKLGSGKEHGYSICNMCYEQLQQENEDLKRKLTNIISWLETNQSTVFKEGIWDVIDLKE